MSEYTYRIDIDWVSQQALLWWEGAPTWDSQENTPPIEKLAMLFRDAADLLSQQSERVEPL